MQQKLWQPEQRQHLKSCVNQRQSGNILVCCMCVCACACVCVWLRETQLATKCQTQMSPISHWQSMEIYRKLRTNKILRLFAFSFTMPTRSNLPGPPTVLSLSLPLASSCLARLGRSPFSWLIEMHFLDCRSSNCVFFLLLLAASNKTFCIAAIQTQLAATPTHTHAGYTHAASC